MVNVQVAGPVVVTGASGFIGGALIGALRRRGADVVAVSRRQPGQSDCWHRVVDYRDTPCPAGAILVHLAEEATIPEANTRGQAHIDAVHGTVEALAGKSYKRIVYASSGQIYRGGAETPYIAGKRAAETIVLAHGGAVVRLANIYGPNMRNRTLIGDILRQIPGEGVLIIHDASPRRDFLWIDDAADGLAAVALGTATGIFNLGSGSVISAGDLARLALEAAGESARPVQAVKQSSGDDIVQLDTDPLFITFDWRPKVSIAEGIACLVRGHA
jgi:nucleoside-diphosphate-sugar epimerase